MINKDLETILLATDELNNMLRIMEMLENRTHVSVTVEDGVDFDITDAVLLSSIRNFIKDRAKNALDNLKLSKLE